MCDFVIILLNNLTGHELKGLIGYYNCELPDLCLPLMMLLDYKGKQSQWKCSCILYSFKGFRLIATALLPVDKSTLLYQTRFTNTKKIIDSERYGSCDAGNTIVNGDEVLEEHRKKSAQVSTQNNPLSKISF